MFHNEQSLIAKKMILESTWNQMFLEKGAETIDMMQIEFEQKEWIIGEDYTHRKYNGH